MTGRAEVLVIRPTAGGVAHVSGKVVNELRRQGRRVSDVALAESAAPAWRAAGRAVRMARRIRRAGTVHVELGRTTSAPFWFGVVAVTLRRDVTIVAHDAPTLVDAPGAAVMPARRGWRDAVAHKIFAPLLDKPVNRYVLRRAGAVAVLSAAAARQCADRGIAPVGLINHGADAPIPGPPPSRAKTIVFGGFLSPAKGLEDLLEAWRQVGPTTDHRLLIAGKCARQHTDWLAALREDGEAMANPPRWLGYLDDREFNDVIATAAVVVLPYRSSNPSSGILVRAMVQGRPVVATRVTAMESLITDDVTGDLIDVADVAGLAGKLAGLIRNPSRRDALGAAAARVAAERHTWARQVADLERVYALPGGKP